MLSSAAAVSIDNVATATRNGSIEGPSSSPNATRSARAWGAGSVLAQPHHREQQPVQGRERQRRLDLEPLGAQHRSPRSARCDERFEQGRLAHTRLTAHHQAAGRPVPRLLEERGQVRELVLTADQHAVERTTATTSRQRAEPGALAGASARPQSRRA